MSKKFAPPFRKQKKRALNLGDKNLFFADMKAVSSTWDMVPISKPNNQKLKSTLSRASQFLAFVIFHN
jgi:hypothetical protein